jgi:hypothetical protein
MENLQATVEIDGGWTTLLRVYSASAACAWLFSYGLGCCLHRLLPNLCSELDAQLLRSPCSRASSIQSHNP